MKDKNRSWWFLIVIGVIIVILVYLFSFGYFNLSDESESDNKSIEEDIDPLVKLKTRHKKYVELAQKRRELREKLNKKFKRIYLAVRLGLCFLYIGLNLTLYFSFGVQNLGDILNWNELALLILAFISFATFGTLANLKEFIDGIKIKLENRIFGKHLNIDDKLHEDERGIILLEAEINEVKQKKL